jgi:phosphoglucosamine mutase
MTSDSRQLFGTDGIRGVAGEYPLDASTVFAVGRAVGDRLHTSTGPERVLVGQDTRESSAWIGDTVSAGLIASGMSVESAGVITTPGVAYLTRANGFAAGFVVSASHNPWQDNGIKVFSRDGFKLPDDLEHQIEREIFSLLGSVTEPGRAAFQSLPGDAELREQYVRWLAANAPDVGGFRVLVDCANGAASAIAHDVFERCKLQATFMNDGPNGRNINQECGALHPECVAKAVAASPGKYDLGITLDGDADRALFSDEQGRVVNGDRVLLLAARDMQARDTLTNNLVVATTMSNMGLEIALRRSGILMSRASVGDKYVLEEMRKAGAALGGEQSGHIIFRDTDTTTGDGLLTALRVLEVMRRSGKSVSDLVADMQVFPQIIKNVRVREKKPLLGVAEIEGAIRTAEREVDGNGRVVVRYSGTEPLARVMVEADTEERMRRIADDIAGAIQRTLGTA